MGLYEKKNGKWVKTVGGGGIAGGGSGLTDAEKTLLITILRNAVYSNNQSANITALEALFNVSGGGTEPDEPDVPVDPDEPDEPDVPVVTLTGITATYSGGDVAVGTAVTDLTGIVVTAHYSDGSTQTVTGYTLSGTIVEGSNTVTVSYQGMTATLVVTGVAESSGIEVIDLAPYLKAENRKIDTVYNGVTIRWSEASGNNIYSVPVSAGTYRLSGYNNSAYNGPALQNAYYNTVEVGKLPLLAKDTDLSTNSIAFTLAESCSYTKHGVQDDGRYLWTLDIVFASDGYFLFSINTSQNQTLAKVVA